jgi:hypothetical protein
VKPETRPMVLEKLSGTARPRQSDAKPAADESHAN